MKKARILVVGSYATGLVMEVPRLPSRGETLIGRGYREVHGGKGSNQAVQAARLGAQTAFLVRVGADARGGAMEALMREEGVRPDGILRDAERPTGVGFIVVDAQGHNLITIDPGANGALEAADLEARRSLFEEADVVVAQLEIPLATALAAMRMGRACGARTILNPAPAADLSASDLSAVDFLTPNETETLVAAAMPEGPMEAAMRRLKALGCGHVITTTGAQGCLWLDEAEALRVVPGFSVKAVDTVGAGDAFAGAFAVRLAEGYPPAEALVFAHAAAALSVTRPDTIPSYHRRAEVERFLKERA